MAKMGSTAKRACAASIAAVAAIGGAFALSGCTSSIEIGGLKIGGSAHTGSADKDNAAVVQDVNGVEYATVVEIFPVEGNDLSVDDLKQVLSDQQINYYQLITANNMGTPTQEDAHLYMTSDVTYTELCDIANKVASTGEFTANVMTQEAYEAWVEDTSGGYDVTRNESTHMGPAAQAQK